MSVTELKELVAQLVKTQEAAIRDMAETVKVTTKTVNATSRRGCRPL